MTRNPPPGLPKKLIKNRASEHANYKTLLGCDAWARLHPDIQKRFSTEYAHRETTYEGIMDVVSMSAVGRIWAQLCRLIGAPLAFYQG